MSNYRNKDIWSDVAMYGVILQSSLSVTDFSKKIVTWHRKETNIEINFVKNVEDAMLPFWKERVRLL